MNSFIIMNEWSGNKTCFHLGGEIISEFDGAGKNFSSASIFDLLFKQPFLVNL